MFYILRIMFISHETSEKKHNIFNLNINEENSSLFSLHILNFLWILETKKKNVALLHTTNVS